jgi:NADPH2:quinone reductase
MPLPGEVRVKVRTIGINFPEVLSRMGIYGWAPKPPYTLGMEAYGEIDQLGNGVTGRSIGEPVIVGTQYGAYAECLCVPATRALAPPIGFTPEQSSAFLVNYLTAWIGLVKMARIMRSDTVVVTSAAGGVGSAVVQLAKGDGARVIGLAGSSKQEIVRSLGADEAIDYGQSDWVSKLRKATGGRGADVIFELVGGDVYAGCTKVIAPMGRIVVAGISGLRIQRRNPLSWLLAARKLPKPNLREMLMNSYGMMSFHIGRLFIEQGLDAGIWEDLIQFVESNGIKPFVSRVYEFDEIPEAHRALEARSTFGKVVARV